MSVLIRAFFRLLRALLAPAMWAWDHWPVSGKVRRTPEVQARLDERTRGMALYHFPTCPFCIRARRAMRRLGIRVELRDARNDPAHRRELEEQGGKVQVPCLRIPGPAGDTWLYESDDIIRHFEGLAAEVDGGARVPREAGA